MKSDFYRKGRRQKRVYHLLNIKRISTLLHRTKLILLFFSFTFSVGFSHASVAEPLYYVFSNLSPSADKYPSAAMVCEEYRRFIKESQDAGNPGGTTSITIYPSESIPQSLKTSSLCEVNWTRGETSIDYRRVVYSGGCYPGRRIKSNTTSDYPAEYGLMGEYLWRGDCESDLPDKDDGCPGANGRGNPCNVATGTKFQSAIDFSSNDFSLTRSYSSNTYIDVGFGVGWRSNFHKMMMVQMTAQNVLTLVLDNGRGEIFVNASGEWTGDADSNLNVVENDNHYAVYRNDGSIEKYSLSGFILSESDVNGKQTTYLYDINEQLMEVTNSYGQKIFFTHTNGHISLISDMYGTSFRYEYDAKGNLITVIYPDETPTIDDDNPKISYHYLDIYFRNRLVGITDENNNRYSTYTYDEYGKAIATEHAQTTNPVGQERFELDYQTEVTP